MKRIIGLLLAVCLILGCIPAMAAGPVISKQPETQIVKKVGGSASFSIKVKNQTAITWYFVNPQTGEMTSAKKLAKTIPEFSKVKISNPNSKKMTIKKVPEAMHGWFLFVRCKGGGRTVDSDIVQILIKGMDVPDYEVPSLSDGPAATPAPEDEDEETSSSNNKKDKKKKKGSSATAAPTATPEPTPTPGPKIINITARNALLYEQTGPDEFSEDGQPALRFEEKGSFMVRAKEGVNVSSWSVNGERFTPPDGGDSFVLTDVTENTSVVAKVRTAAQIAAAAQLDYSNMCTVTCEDCYFTFLVDDMERVSSGQVPVGATIRVLAGEPDTRVNRKYAVNKGFVINGEKAAYVNKPSFSYTVTEDTTIVMKK